MIFATILSQLASGIALAFSLVPEGNLISSIRASKKFFGRNKYE
jgi:hypothetical protein